jgi:AcrR family transcriptional regulator
MVEASDGGTGARRRSAIEEVRQRQIIDAAIAVVAREGYARASMARIAEQAGLSKGLLSYHFRNKEHLLDQALRTTFTAITDEVIEEMDLGASAPEMFRDAIRRVAAYGVAHRDRLRAIDQIARNLRDAEGRPLLTLADYEGAYAQIELLFRRGQQEGTFRAFDTRVMAATYQAALDTMFAYADAYPGTDLTQYAEALGDLLLAAVVAPGGGAQPASRNG